MRLLLPAPSFTGSATAGTVVTSSSNAARQSYRLVPCAAWTAPPSTPATDKSHHVDSSCSPLQHTIGLRSAPARRRTDTRTHAFWRRGRKQQDAGAAAVETIARPDECVLATADPRLLSTATQRLLFPVHDARCCENTSFAWPRNSSERFSNTHRLAPARRAWRCCDRVLSFDVVVQKDDTVDSIARKLALPREVLLSANGGPSLSRALKCCLQRRSDDQRVTGRLTVAALRSPYKRRDAPQAARSSRPVRSCTLWWARSRLLRAMRCRAVRRPNSRSLAGASCTRQLKLSRICGDASDRHHMPPSLVSTYVCAHC